MLNFYSFTLMGPMKIASAHKQVYKIFKKGLGHELFLNQNLGYAAKKFVKHWPRTTHCSTALSVHKKMLIKTYIKKTDEIFFIGHGVLCCIVF